MTDNNRNASDAARLRAMFACGTLLGACLGFAAGHVFVWTRVTSANRDAAWLSHDAEGLHDLRSVGEPGFPGSEGLAQLAAPRDAPRSFFAGNARRLVSSPPVDMTAAQRPIRVTTELSATGEEPENLPQAAQAAPIDAETKYREQITRSIIAQEIPHASAQEQDVWFDVLHGLDASDVKGILRMRKHVGGAPGGMAVAPGRALAPLSSLPALPATPQQPVTATALADTRECLRRVRNIRLHNLCNAETAGYQRLVPVMSDAGSGSGADNSGSSGIAHGELRVRLARIEPSLILGEFHQTGHALDIAIEGPGFLQVRQNGRTRLTRSGRLMIDDDRHLALATTSEPWRLDPPIIVPEEARSLTIDLDGRVTVRNGDSEDETELGTIPLMAVLDPSGMRYAGDGLFEATRSSGPGYRLTRGVALRQFGLERLSRTVIRDERNALAREEQLIEQLERAAGD